jgi:SH3-like domain-containing protein
MPLSEIDLKTAPGQGPRLARGAAGRVRPALAVLAALLWSCAALAEYRSISENPAVLYDGPSLKASRLFVAPRGMPVEVISTDGTWVKVRDSGGELTWVERTALSERRTLVVDVPVADVRAAPDETAPVVFQVGQGVGLDYAEQPDVPPGWLRVRHADGSTGFVRLSQVWGG